MLHVFSLRDLGEMKAQNRSLKKKGTVSISGVKAFFSASTSVPRTEHSSWLPTPRFSHA